MHYIVSVYEMLLSLSPPIKKLIKRQNVTQLDVQNIAETIIFNKRMIQELLNMSGFLHSRVVLQRPNNVKSINKYLTIETEKTKNNLINNNTTDNTDMVKLLLEMENIDVNKGKPLYYSSKEPKTPLYYAVEKGHTDIVKLLLGMDNIDVNKNEPLYYAL